MPENKETAWHHTVPTTIIFQSTRNIFLKIVRQTHSESYLSRACISIDINLTTSPDPLKLCVKYCLNISYTLIVVSLEPG